MPVKPKPKKSKLNQFQLLEKIRAKVTAEPKLLDVHGWHCGTAHCLAGWAQVLAGDIRKHPADEGIRLIPCASHLFYAWDFTVRLWLKNRGWIAENPEEFRAAMKKVKSKRRTK